MNRKGIFFAGAAAALATLLAATGAQATTNLLTNGDFETGDFSGWNVSASFTGVSTAPFDSLYAESGTYFAALGAVGCCGSVSQTITDTPGQSLLLTYYHMSDGATPNYLEADWNGVQIPASVIVDAGDQRGSGYVLYSFRVAATGVDTLTFLEQNDPAYDALDNVSLTAVPEPATWAMMLIGFAGGCASLRRGRRGATATA